MGGSTGDSDGDANLGAMAEAVSNPYIVVKYIIFFLLKFSIFYGSI